MELLCVNANCAYIYSRFLAMMLSVIPNTMGMKNVLRHYANVDNARQNDS